MLNKRSFICLACLGGLLMGAVLGWTSIMRKLAEAEAREIELAEMNVLRTILNNFELRTGGGSNSPSWISYDAVEMGGGPERYRISGYRMKNEAGNRVPEKEHFVEIDYSAIKTGEQLLDVIENMKITDPNLLWGNVEDGRDQFGLLLLRLSRQTKSGHDLVYPFLKNWMETRGGFTEGLKPGFMLILISELEKTGEEDSLKRLRTHFEIRAVEGQVWELQDEFDAGTMLGAVEAGNHELYLTREQAESFIGGGNLIELSVDPPGDRAWVGVPGLKSFWGNMSLKREGSSSQIVDNWKALAAWTIAALVAFILILVLMAWQSMKTARSRISLAGAVAHELRTPLAGQRVILESLEARKAYDSNYVGMALRENERLSALSDEFLTFSRLERGVLELQMTALPLTEVLDDMVGDFSKQHPDREIIFQSESSVCVHADAAAVVTIVRNLLENALKYSDAPSSVLVEIVQNEVEAGFKVGDEGVGLSASEQKKIFRQFYRVEQKLSRSQDGLGLGLSIVKKLVDAMDGRIVVESEKGKGSTFSVYLKKGGQI